VAREWQPGIYPKAPRKGPFWVKYRVYGRVEWAKKKGFRTRGEAQAFGVKMRVEYSQRAAGLWNQKAEDAKLPIQGLLDEFEQHVRLGLRDRKRRRESPHAKSVQQILKMAMADMSVQRLGDLDRAKATDWLARMRSRRRPKTLQQYRGMLQRFGEWLVDEDRVDKSPFRNLPMTPVDDHEHRQALEPDDVLRICRGAVQRVLQRSFGKTRAMALPIARRRALIYLVTYLTTMRNDALANFAWSWIDKEFGCIRVPAQWVKTPGKAREQRIPLHDGLAELLNAVRRERGVQRGRPVADDELVVGAVDKRGFARLPETVPENLRKDAEFCDIKGRDDRGRVLDLTAMRTSCASSLRRLGVPTAIISEIMHTARKSTAERHYIDADHKNVVAELRGFLNRIPFKADDVRGLLFDVTQTAAEGRGPAEGPSRLSTSERERAQEAPGAVEGGA